MEQFETPQETPTQPDAKETKPDAPSAIQEKPTYTGPEKKYDSTNPLDILTVTFGKLIDKGKLDELFIDTMLLAQEGGFAPGTEVAEQRTLILTQIMCQLAIHHSDGSDIGSMSFQKAYLADARRMLVAATRTEKSGIDTLRARQKDITFYTPLRADKPDGSKLLGVSHFLRMKDHPEFKSVCEEIGNNTYTLNLFNGKTQINIGFNRESLHFLRGLSFIKQESPGMSLTQLLSAYGNKLVHFFNQCERKGCTQFDHIVYVNTFSGDDILKGPYEKLLKPGSDKSTNFSSYTDLDLDSIRMSVADYAAKGGSTLLVVRGHGFISAKGDTKGTGKMLGAPEDIPATQEWFERIANDSTLTPGLVMDVDSCFSGAKFDGKKNKTQILSLNSYNDLAWSSYDKTIVDATSSSVDYNGDGITGYADIRLHTLMTYQDSFVPTRFIDGSGNEANLS